MCIYIYIYIFIGIYIYIYILSSNNYIPLPKTYLEFIGCDSKHMFFIAVALLGLKPGSNHSYPSVEAAIRLDFTVGVQCLVVDILGHLNFSPNVVF